MSKTAAKQRVSPQGGFTNGASELIERSSSGGFTNGASELLQN